MKFCQFPNNTYFLYNSNVFTPCNAKLKTPFPDIPKFKEDTNIWGLLNPHYINKADEETLFSEFITFVGFLGISRRKRKNKNKELVPVSSYGFRNSSVSRINLRRQSNIQLRRCACALRIQDSIYKHHKRNLAKLETKRSLSLDSLKHKEQKKDNNAYDYHCINSQESNALDQNEVVYDKCNPNLQASGISNQSKTVYSKLSNNSYVSSLSDQSKLGYGNQSVISQPSNLSNQNKIVYVQQSINSQVSDLSDQSRVVYDEQSGILQLSSLSERNNITYDQQSINSRESYLFDQTKTVYAKQNGLSEQNNLTYDKQAINLERLNLHQTQAMYDRHSIISQLSELSDQSRIIYGNSEASCLSNQSRIVYGKQCIDSQTSNLLNQSKLVLNNQSGSLQSTNLSNHDKLVYEYQNIDSLNQSGIVPNLSNCNKFAYDTSSISVQPSDVSNQNKLMYSNDSVYSKSSSLSDERKSTHKSCPWNLEPTSLLNQHKATSAGDNPDIRLLPTYLFSKTKEVNNSNEKGCLKRVKTYHRLSDLNMPETIATESHHVRMQESLHGPPGQVGNNQYSNLQDLTILESPENRGGDCNNNRNPNVYLLNEYENAVYSKPKKKHKQQDCNEHHRCYESDASKEHKKRYQHRGNHLPLELHEYRQKKSTQTALNNSTDAIISTDLQLPLMGAIDKSEKAVGDYSKYSPVNLDVIKDNDENTQRHCYRACVCGQMLEIEIFRKQGKGPTKDDVLISCDKDLSVQSFPPIEGCDNKRNSKETRNVSTTCSCGTDCTEPGASKHYTNAVYARGQLTSGICPEDLRASIYQNRKSQSGGGDNRKTFSKQASGFQSQDSAKQLWECETASHQSDGNTDFTNSNFLEKVSTSKNDNHMRIQTPESYEYYDNLNAEIIRILKSKIDNIEKLLLTKDTKNDVKPHSNKSSKSSTNIIFSTADERNGFKHEKLKLAESNSENGLEKRRLLLEYRPNNIIQEHHKPLSSAARMHEHHLPKGMYQQTDIFNKKLTPIKEETYLISSVTTPKDNAIKRIAPKNSENHHDASSNKTIRGSSNSSDKYRFKTACDADFLQELRQKMFVLQKTQENVTANYTIKTDVNASDNLIYLNRDTNKRQSVCDKEFLTDKDSEDLHVENNLQEEEEEEKVDNNQDVSRKEQKLSKQKSLAYEEQNKKKIKISKVISKIESEDEEKITETKTTAFLKKGGDSLEERHYSYQYYSTPKRKGSKQNTSKQTSRSWFSKQTISDEEIYDDVPVEKKSRSLLRKQTISDEEFYVPTKQKQTPSDHDSKRKNKSRFSKQTVSEEEIYDDVPAKKKSRNLLRKQTPSDDEFYDNVPAKRKQTPGDNEINNDMPSKRKNKSWFSKQTVSDEEIHDDDVPVNKKSRNLIRKQTPSDESYNVPSKQKQTLSDDEIPNKRKNKNWFSKQTASDEEIHDDDVPVKNKSRNLIRKHTSSEEFYDDVPAKQKQIPNDDEIPNKRKNKNWFSKQTISDEEINDHDVPVKKKSRNLIRKQTPSDDEFYAPAKQKQTPNDDEINNYVPSKRKNKSWLSKQTVSEEEIHDDDVPAKKKGKNILRKQTPSDDEFYDDVPAKQKQTPSDDEIPNKRKNKSWFSKQTVSDEEIHDDDVPAKKKNNLLRKQTPSDDEFYDDVPAKQKQTPNDEEINNDVANKRINKSWFTRQTVSDEEVDNDVSTKKRNNNWLKKQIVSDEEISVYGLVIGRKTPSLLGKQSASDDGSYDDRPSIGSGCNCSKRENIEEVEEAQEMETEVTSKANGGLLENKVITASCWSTNKEKPKKDDTKQTLDDQALNSTQPQRRSLRNSITNNMLSKISDDRKSKTPPQTFCPGRCNEEFFIKLESKIRALERTVYKNELPKVDEEDFSLCTEYKDKSSVVSFDMTTCRDKSNTSSDVRKTSYASYLRTKSKSLFKKKKPCTCEHNVDKRNISKMLFSCRSKSCKCSSDKEPKSDTSKVSFSSVKEEEADSSAKDVEKKPSKKSVSVLSFVEQQSSLCGFSGKKAATNYKSEKKSSLSCGPSGKKSKQKSDADSEHSTVSFISEKEPVEGQSLVGKSSSKVRKSKEKVSSQTSRYSQSEKGNICPSNCDTNKLMINLQNKVNMLVKAVLGSAPHHLPKVDEEEIETGIEDLDVRSLLSIYKSSRSGINLSTKDSNLSESLIRSEIQNQDDSKTSHSARSLLCVKNVLNDQSSKTSLSSRSIIFAKEKNRSQSDRQPTGPHSRSKSLLSQLSISKPKTERRGDEQSSKASVLSIIANRIKNKSQSSKLSSRKHLLSRSFSRLKAAKQSSKASMLSAISNKSKNQSQGGKLTSQKSILAEASSSKLNTTTEGDARSSKTSLVSILSNKTKSRSQVDESMSQKSVLAQASSSKLKTTTEGDEQSSRTSQLSCTSARLKKDKNESGKRLLSASFLKTARENDEGSSKTSILSFTSVRAKDKSQGDKLPSKASLLSQAVLSKLKTGRKSREQSSKTSLLSIIAAKKAAKSQSRKMPSKASLLSQKVFSVGKLKTAQQSDEKSSKTSLLSITSAKVKSNKPEQPTICTSDICKCKSNTDLPPEADLISESVIESEAKLPSKKSLLSQAMFSRLKSKSHTDGPSSKTNHLSDSIAFGRAKSSSKTGKLPSKKSLLSQAIFSKVKSSLQNDEQTSKSSAISCSSAKMKTKSSRLPNSSQTEELSSQSSLLAKSIIAANRKHGSHIDDILLESDLVGTKTGTPPSKKSMLSQTVFSRLKSKSRTDGQSSKTSHLSDSIAFGRQKSSSKSGRLSSKKDLVSQAMLSRQKSSQQDDNETSKSSMLSFSSAKVQTQGRNGMENPLLKKSILLQSVLNEEPSETSVLSQSIVSSKARSGSESLPCKPEDENQSNDQLSEDFSEDQKSENRSTINQSAIIKSKSKNQNDELSSETNITSQSITSADRRRKSQLSTRQIFWKPGDVECRRQSANISTQVFLKMKGNGQKNQSNELPLTGSFKSQSVFHASRSRSDVVLSNRNLFSQPTPFKSVNTQNDDFSSETDFLSHSIPKVRSKSQTAFLSRIVSYKSKNKKQPEGSLIIPVKSKGTNPTRPSSYKSKSRDYKQSKTNSLSQSITSAKTKSKGQAMKLSPKKDASSTSGRYKYKSKIADEQISESSLVSQSYIPMKKNHKDQIDSSSEGNLLYKSLSQSGQEPSESNLIAKSFISAKAKSKNQTANLISTEDLPSKSVHRKSRSKSTKDEYPLEVTSRKKKRNKQYNALSAQEVFWKGQFNGQRDEDLSEMNLLPSSRRVKQFDELSIAEVFWKEKFQDHRGENLCELPSDNAKSKGQTIKSTSRSAYYKSKSRSRPSNYEKNQKRNYELSSKARRSSESDENSSESESESETVKNRSQTTKPILRSSLLSQSTLYKSRNRSLSNQLPRTDVVKQSIVSFKEKTRKQVSDLSSQEIISELKSELVNNASTKRNSKSNSINPGSSLLSHLLHLKTRSKEYPPKTDIPQSLISAKENNRKQINEPLSQQVPRKLTTSIQDYELSSEDSSLSHSSAHPKTRNKTQRAKLASKPGLSSSNNRQSSDEQPHMSDSELNRKILEELLSKLRSRGFDNKPPMNVSVLAAKTKSVNHTAKLFSKPESDYYKSESYYLSKTNKLPTQEVTLKLRRDSYSSEQNVLSQSKEFSKARQKSHLAHSRSDSDEQLSKTSMEPLVSSLLPVEENIQELPLKFKNDSQSDEQPSEENLLTNSKNQNQSYSQSGSHKPRSKRQSENQSLSLKTKSESQTSQLPADLTSVKSKSSREAVRLISEFLLQAMLHKSRNQNVYDNYQISIIPTMGQDTRQTNTISAEEMGKLTHSCQSEEQPSQVSVASVKEEKSRPELPELKSASQSEPIEATFSTQSVASAEANKNLLQSSHYKLRICRQRSEPSSKVDFTLQSPRTTSRSTIEKPTSSKNLSQSALSSARSRSQSDDWASETSFVSQSALSTKDEKMNEKPSSKESLFSPSELSNSESKTHNHAKQTEDDFTSRTGNRSIAAELPRKGNLVSQSIFHVSTNNLDNVPPNGSVIPQQLLYQAEHPAEPSEMALICPLVESSSPSKGETVETSNLSPSFKARNESHTDTQSVKFTEAKTKSNTDEQSSLSHSVMLAKLATISQSNNKPLSKINLLSQTNISIKSKTRTPSSRKPSKSSLLYYTRPEDTIPEVEKEEDVSKTSICSGQCSGHCFSKEDIGENSSQNKEMESSSKENKDLDDSSHTSVGIDNKESTVEPKSMETVCSQPSRRSLTHEVSKHKSSLTQTEISQENYKSSKHSQSSQTSFKNDKSSMASSSEDFGVGTTPIRNKSVTISKQLDSFVQVNLKSKSSLTDNSGMESSNQILQPPSITLGQLPCMCNIPHRCCRKHTAPKFDLLKAYNDNVRKSSQVLTVKLNKLPFVCNTGECCRGKLKEKTSAFNFIKIYNDNLRRSSQAPSIGLKQLPYISNRTDCPRRQEPSTFNFVMPSTDNVGKSSSTLSLLRNENGSPVNEFSENVIPVLPRPGSYFKYSNDKLNTQTLKSLEHKIDTFIRNTCTPPPCNAIKQLESKVKDLENVTFQNNATAVIKNMQDKIEALEKACSPSNYNVETVKDIQNKIEDFEKVCPENCYNASAIKNLQQKIDKLEKMLSQQNEDMSSETSRDKDKKLNKKWGECRPNLYNSFKSKFNLRKSNSKKLKFSQQPLECEEVQTEMDLYAAYLLSPDGPDGYKLEEKKQNQRKLIEEISTELLMQRNELKELKCLLRHHLSQIYKGPKIPKNKKCNSLSKTPFVERSLHDGKVMKNLSHNNSPPFASKSNNISLDFLKKDKYSPIDIQYYSMFDWSDLHHSDNLLQPTTSSTPHCYSCPTTCANKKDTHIQECTKSEMICSPHATWFKKKAMKNVVNMTRTNRGALYKILQNLEYRSQ
ncbi:hypothetical protein ILUMI_01536 [Ignelater luminosus]|uniref:Uncharacterized protein n=1 Tax=Ignelater luminosus TaxID=2038154 RepID=A0A8K0DJI2_IGNLU|nr:hypothetical protein ILUMI_01536 [Ignelater luminosus]